MAEVQNIIKNSEKILLWLYRQNKTMTWLAKELGQTKQYISRKLKPNKLSDKALTKFRQLDCPLYFFVENLKNVNNGKTIY